MGYCSFVHIKISIYSSIYLYTCLYTYLSISIYVSFYLSIYLHILYIVAQHVRIGNPQNLLEQDKESKLSDNYVVGLAWRLRSGHDEFDDTS